MLLESKCKLLVGDESQARLHLADDAAEEDAGEAHHEETKNLYTHTHTHARTHMSEKWDYERVLAEQKPVASANRGARWLKHALFHAHKTRLSDVTVRSVCAQMKAKRRKPIDNELEPFVAAVRFLPICSYINTFTGHTYIYLRREQCSRFRWGKIRRTQTCALHSPARPYSWR